MLWSIACFCPADGRILKKAPPVAERDSSPLAASNIGADSPFPSEFAISDRCPYPGGEGDRRPWSDAE